MAGGRLDLSGPRPALTTDQDAIGVLTDYDVWAIVGLGADSSRPAYEVAAWLQQRGKTIVPIHPRPGTVLGEPVWTALADVPFQIQVVDIFRRSDQAGAHVDEAIAIGARAVWLQLGVIDDAAVGRARAAGLRGIADRCPHLEGPRLLGWPS